MGLVVPCKLEFNRMDGHVDGAVCRCVKCDHDASPSITNQSPSSFQDLFDIVEQVFIIQCLTQHRGITF